MDESEFALDMELFGVHLLERFGLSKTRIDTLLIQFCILSGITGLLSSQSSFQHPLSDAPMAIVVTLFAVYTTALTNSSTVRRVRVSWGIRPILLHSRKG